MFSLLLLYFLWSQALIGNPNVAGYTAPMIFTYIFLANFLNAVVLSSRTDQVAGDIRNGAIINQLLKPLNYFYIVGTREVVDKIMNIAFSICEIIIFAAIFRPTFYIPHDLLNIFVFLGFVILALLISFYISLGLSLIAFWTSEIWAPRFIFMIFFSLVAGTLFPLDIFPKQLYDFLLLTPFPYLVFVPAKILILGVTPETTKFAVTGLVWLFIVFSITTIMWRKGLREFAFFGR
jgi:ABC-2 type transport system permease protein